MDYSKREQLKRLKSCLPLICIRLHFNHLVVVGRERMRKKRKKSNGARQDSPKLHHQRRTKPRAIQSREHFICTENTTKYLFQPTHACLGCEWNIGHGHDIDFCNCSIGSACMHLMDCLHGCNIQGNIQGHYAQLMKWGGSRSVHQFHDQ